MRKRSVVLGAFVAAVTVAAVMSASASPRHPVRTPKANTAAAQSDAESLLAKLLLPAGATQLPAEPAGDHSQLKPYGGPATPNRVDVGSWWRVPGTVDDLIAFEKAHEPSGSAVVLQSGGSGPGYSGRGVGFGWPPVPDVLGLRWLVVNATALPDGSTGVRADGISVWVTPRPASERVPRARLVRITVTHGHKDLQGPITVRRSAKVSKLVALVDQLPVFQPGAYSCPADWGVRVALDFYATKRAHTPLAVATIEVGGCGAVALTLHARKEPELADSRPSTGRYVPIENRVAAIIGVKLRTAP